MKSTLAWAHGAKKNLLSGAYIICEENLNQTPNWIGVNQTPAKQKISRSEAAS